MAAARIIRRLAELLDVTVTSPADGEVLTYDSGTSKWKNETAGGGSAPTSREEWSDGAAMIADGDGAWLPWDTSTGPDAVLDNTIPAHPTIITAGVYLVSVIVNCGVMSQGGYYDVGLHMDRTGFNASMYAKSSQAAAPYDRVSDVTLALAWYCPADAQVGVFVDNHDGGESRNFTFPYGHIVRLS